MKSLGENPEKASKYTAHFGNLFIQILYIVIIDKLCTAAKHTRVRI